MKNKINKNLTIPGTQQQSGFVLVTALVFLLIIMFAAISSMEGAQLDYKISANTVYQDIAFQASETGRTSAGEGVSEFIYNRSWAGISLDGLTYAANYDPATDGVGNGEDLYDTTSMAVDMNLNIDRTNVEPIDAQISIVKAQGITTKGSGLQQLSGYEGAGKSAGNGGINLIFEFRSTGLSAASAQAVTASEYRIIP